MRKGQFLRNVPMYTKGWHPFVYIGRHRAKKRGRSMGAEKRPLAIMDNDLYDTTSEVVK